MAVLLNCGEDAAAAAAAVRWRAAAARAGAERGRMDLRTYGIGAQILRELRRRAA